jgi:peptidyl-prolyl cis-trans isomerase SurA
VQKLSALLLLCLALLPLGAEAAQPAAQAAQAARTRIGIAAIVNDDAITWSDIENRTRLFIASAGKGSPPPEARQQVEAMVLNRLIDERLQLREAKNLGITVEDIMVQKAFADIARQNNLTPEEFRDKLQGSGIKMSALTDQIKAEIAWSLVVRRKLRPQIVVSENEIDTAITQLQSKQGQTEYQVAEILLKVPSTEMEGMVRTDAEKLAQDITAGAQFSMVARQKSQAPGAATGGDLGWIQQGVLDKALDEQLARMHPGEVSPPIRTDKGYHILFLRNMRDAGAAMAPQAPAPQAPPQQAAAAPVPAVSNGRPSLVQADTILHLKQLVMPVATGEPAAVTNAKLARAESLKGEVTSCEAMDQKAREFLAEGSGDLGRGKLSQLPEHLRHAVISLPVGTLSEPIKTENSIAVVMVCEREDIAGAPVGQQAASAPATPAPAPAEQANSNGGPTSEQSGGAPVPQAPKPPDAAREQVANQIGMKRLNQLADRYLKDLRATAYIERR